ncbi:hypothetical protein ACUNWD_08090 [Sunxiuqinia sp. A32]|uniref:hypothetical protein n=1 Tax=Sunxiuqinia sp. A32 TaxID=3461496 RepID=UPI0040456E60
MNPHAKAIISHITIIGWIIVLVLNMNEKDELSSFYLRQTLGIYLIGLVGTVIPALGVILGIIAFILWVVSLVGAINQDLKPVFVVGEYFQEWFKGVA